MEELEKNMTNGKWCTVSQRLARISSYRRRGSNNKWLVAINKENDNNLWTFMVTL